MIKLQVKSIDFQNYANDEFFKQEFNKSLTLEMF